VTVTAKPVVAVVTEEKVGINPAITAGVVEADEDETVIVVVPVALADVVAVIVYVPDADVAEEVPLITPVLVLKESPVGRDGEIPHKVAASPEFVGVKDVIATPTTALIVDGV
jgi:hypothetical protein